MNYIKKSKEEFKRLWSHDTKIAKNIFSGLEEKLLATLIAKEHQKPLQTSFKILNIIAPPFPFLIYFKKQITTIRPRLSKSQLL